MQCNRIVILVHERKNLKNDRSFLGEIAKCWSAAGYQVTFLKGIRQYVEADIAILNVDRTVIPDEYMEFLKQYPVVINGNVRDISKRKVSTNLVAFGDDWKGPVIVKTDRNCGGNPEKINVKKLPRHIRMMRKMQEKLPYFCQDRLLMDDYRIYESKGKVPLPVWFNRHLVVERFLPERKDGLYCLRIWMFLGDKESNSICYSDSPIVKSNNIIRREPAGEVPEGLRKARERLGFDFGKFDYVMVDGEPVLFDANRTPSLGAFSQDEMTERFKLLSEGILFFGEQQNQAVEIWPDVAEQWKMYGPPLRPSIHDQTLFISALSPVFQKNSPVRALILGVTPELYHLPWPAGTAITAVDHTQAMIDYVWPGAVENAVCAEWTAIPLADESCDAALCDGGMILMDWPEEHKKFAREMRRVIAPGGLCILRLFCQTGKKERTGDVLNDFFAGAIPDWNHLKLRLWLSMQDNLADGLYQKKMLGEIQRAAPDLMQLAVKIGWPVMHMKMLEKTSNNSTRYFFPKAADIEGLMCGQDGGFEMVSCQTHQGELAENCPLVTFRRLGGNRG